MSRKNRYQKYVNQHQDDYRDGGGSGGNNYNNNYRGGGGGGGNHNDGYKQQNNKYRSNVRNRLGIKQQRRINNNRNNSSLPEHQQNNKSDFDDFYKVTIPHGNKYDEDYVKNLLHQNLEDMDDPTVFYNYSKTNGSSYFFVNNKEKADILRNLSRRIQTTTGQRLVILTSKAPPPQTSINEQNEPLLKQAVASRFNQQTNVLNLSKFRDCDVFKQQGIFMPLHRPAILRQVIDIISANLPNCIALNLSDNRITLLEPLKSLTNLRQLKALDLSKNKIHKIEELDFIKSIDLIELILENNPFVFSYESTTTYVSAIRKIFSNLKKLDHEDLPDQIGFDLGETSNTPQTLGSFIPNNDLKEFISGFLKEYYRMYDSETRQQLMVAYHEQACFTITVSRMNAQYKPNDLILKESHNLMRIRDEQWVKNVKTTNIDIVSFMNKLPITKHNLDSFHVDIPFFSNEFIIVVVNGLFQETFKINKPWVSFCRTFMLTPQNNGFVITNDLFVICPPSMKQLSDKGLIDQGGSTKSTKNDSTMKDYSQTGFPMIPATGGPTQPSTSSTMFNLQHEEIIQKFKDATKMNRQFSIQCLEENQFNPQLAFDVFIKLKQANALPPEAFIE